VVSPQNSFWKPNGSSTGMTSARWVSGPDDETASRFTRLIHSMKKAGYIVDPAWRPTSSNDLARFPMSSPLGDLLLETETTEGIVLSGDAKLIDIVKDLYDAVPPVTE
jgi:hypothetical protein